MSDMNSLPANRKRDTLPDDVPLEGIKCAENHESSEPTEKPLADARKELGFPDLADIQDEPHLDKYGEFGSLTVLSAQKIAKVSAQYYQTDEGRLSPTAPNADELESDESILPGQQTANHKEHVSIEEDGHEEKSADSALDEAAVGETAQCVTNEGPKSQSTERCKDSGDQPGSNCADAVDDEFRLAEHPETNENNMEELNGTFPDILPGAEEEKHGLDLTASADSTIGAADSREQLGNEHSVLVAKVVIESVKLEEIDVISSECPATPLVSEHEWSYGERIASELELHMHESVNESLTPSQSASESFQTPGDIQNTAVVSSIGQISQSDSCVQRDANEKPTEDVSDNASPNPVKFDEMAEYAVADEETSDPMVSLLEIVSNVSTEHDVTSCITTDDDSVESGEKNLVHEDQILLTTSQANNVDSDGCDMKTKLLLVSQDGKSNHVEGPIEILNQTTRLDLPDELLDLPDEVDVAIDSLDQKNPGNIESIDCIGDKSMCGNTVKQISSEGKELHVNESKATTKEALITQVKYKQDDCERNNLFGDRFAEDEFHDSKEEVTDNLIDNEIYYDMAEDLSLLD